MSIVDDIVLLLHGYEEDNPMPDDDDGAKAYLANVHILIDHHFPAATSEDRQAAFQRMADYHNEESRKAAFMFKLLTGLDVEDVVSEKLQ